MELEGGDGGRERVKVDPSFVSPGKVDHQWPLRNVSVPTLVSTLQIKKINLIVHCFIYILIIAKT